MSAVPYTDTAEGARKLLAELATERVNARIVGLEFVVDPHVTGVWGVMDAGGKVRVIIYTAAGDFEVDDEWLYAES